MVLTLLIALATAASAGPDGSICEDLQKIRASPPEKEQFNAGTCLTRGPSSETLLERARRCVAEAPHASSLRVLGLLGGDRDITLLASYTQSNPTIRVGAIDGLGLKNTPAAREALRSVICLGPAANTDRALQWLAQDPVSTESALYAAHSSFYGGAHALAGLDEPWAWSVLEAAVADHARRGSLPGSAEVHALVHSEDSAMPTLSAGLRTLDARPPLAPVAAALGAQGHPRANDTLLAMSESSDRQNRIEAAQNAAYLRIDIARGILERLAEDDDPGVREAGTTGLRLLPSSERRDPSPPNDEPLPTIEPTKDANQLRQRALKELRSSRLPSLTLLRWVGHRDDVDLIGRQLRVPAAHEVAARALSTLGGAEAWAILTSHQERAFQKSPWQTRYVPHEVSGGIRPALKDKLNKNPGFASSLALFPHYRAWLEKALHHLDGRAHSVVRQALVDAPWFPRDRPAHLEPSADNNRDSTAAVAFLEGNLRHEVCGNAVDRVSKMAPVPELVVAAIRRGLARRDYATVDCFAYLAKDIAALRQDLALVLSDPHLRDEQREGIAEMVGMSIAPESDATAERLERDNAPQLERLAYRWTGPSGLAALEPRPTGEALYERTRAVLDALPYATAVEALALLADTDPEVLRCTLHWLDEQTGGTPELDGRDHKPRPLGPEVLLLANELTGHPNAFVADAAWDLLVHRLNYLGPRDPEHVEVVLEILEKVLRAGHRGPVGRGGIWSVMFSLKEQDPRGFAAYRGKIIALLPEGFSTRGLP